MSVVQDMSVERGEPLMFENNDEGQTDRLALEELGELFISRGHSITYFVANPQRTRTVQAMT
jgi:hypothetical protein